MRGSMSDDLKEQVLEFRIECLLRVLNELEKTVAILSVLAGLLAVALFMVLQ